MRHRIQTCLAAGLAMLIAMALSATLVADGPAARTQLKKRRVDRSAAPLRIAFISYANPDKVLRDSQPVAKYLEQYVGVPVKGFVTNDYGSSIVAMQGGQADLAFVDPLAFMMAHERIGARPLLLEIYSGGKPVYHSCVWVHRDSGIKKLKDLQGKTIAFADQIDMSGHLLPRDIFVREGLVKANQLEGGFFKQVYFAGGDEQAIRAVQNKFVEAAGVSQFAYLLLRPEERRNLVSIARSIDSPSHVLMARKGLSSTLSDRVTQALMALDKEDKQDRELLSKLYGVEGYSEAKLSDFANVAKVAARYGLVKNPERFAAQTSARR